MSETRWQMPDGVYTALVTPFRDGRLDKEAWHRLVQRQLAAGVSGLVPVGCTGEAAVLTNAEKEWLVRTCVELAAGRCAVVAGAGSNATAATVANTRAVAAWGADAAMLITPYYNKPQQHGLIEHYRTVAHAVDIPLVLYNVPGRTAVNLLPQTAAVLAAEPNIVALKEASGNLDQIEQAIGQCDLKVFSGDDGLNFAICGLGGRGAISVVSNLLPQTMVQFWRAWEQGDISKAWWLARTLDPVARNCFVESNPVPVKELLHLAGLCEREPRLPLAPAAAETRRSLAHFHQTVLAELLSQDETGAEGKTEDQVAPEPQQARREGVE
jgi:4-hydroxy-tetrahydrodipicolinate synthase